MKIATYNINGIKARLQTVTDWLAETTPDIVLMQEIKSLDETFPREHFEDLGYQVETHGQKGFNGVAILSRVPLEDVSRGLPGDNDDPQARWIEATVIGKQGALRLCNLYLPNGNPVELDAAGEPVAGGKYAYKLAWMARLKARAAALLETEMPALIAGDYNIIPQAEDAKNPEKWRDDALFLPRSRRAYREIVALGYTDALEASGMPPETFTFWDFQRGAYDKNDGIRIDHVLLSPGAADMLEDAGVDAWARGRAKPSDHVPVWVELDV